MEYRYIDTEKALSAYLDNLINSGRELIALDIECESNLHVYGEKLCLVQIFDGRDAAIIDPFKTPMNMIKEIMENRSIMKIMFDAPGDRAFLYKNCGIDLKSVLDLQVAVSLLDYEKKDLSSVLKKALNVDSGKSKKKFQMYNWGTRPLKDSAIEYAFEDVIYLFDLKTRLLSDIVSAGLLDRFILNNLQVQNKPHIYNTRPKLMRSKTFDDMKKKDQAVFEKLFSIREEFAKSLNFPPHLVLPNDLLFKLTKGSVKIHDVNFAKKMPFDVRDRMIEEMQKAICSRA